jgi:ADP-ribosyl-[dinitrogen reductase] hydrolase
MVRGMRTWDPDRCAGVLLGSAAGDALGAGYEFGAPPSARADMIGGGLGQWERGEWTDDTQMAICIAEEASTGKLDLDKVAGRFLAWYREGPKDVGIQTSDVLSAASIPAEVALAASRRFENHPRNSAGNGSLMRTGPVALAALGNDDALVSLARDTSALTHADPVATEACVLWCVAIDRAVRESRLDGVMDGVSLLEADRQQFWLERIEQARSRPPSQFSPNGFVVTAFQAALASIWQTPVPAEMPCRHLQDALQTAVKVGDDTDMVAAIAGSLLGARWGATAVPVAWKAILHGWPGYRSADLVRLAVLTARGGRADAAGWPAAGDMTAYYERQWPAPVMAVPLAEDSGVVLANVYGVDKADADVVVSLCRVGSKVPSSPLRVEVGLIDSDELVDNPNLDFILVDLARSISAWRDQGKTVAVHCVRAERRTPAVASAFLAERLSISGEEAWELVARQLPTAQSNRSFAAALRSRWPEAPPVARAVRVKSIGDREDAAPLPEPMLGPRFDKAMAYASGLHRTQLRKGTSVPYVSHLLGACSLVLENGGDEDEAIAALLHDAAEDQGGRATLDAIRERFGGRVAGIVAACSNTLGADRASPLEQKRAYLSHLGTDDVPRSVLLVSASGTVHNLGTIIADHHEIGDRAWKRFKLAPAENLWYYQSLAEIFERRLGGRLARALNNLVIELESAVRSTKTRPQQT